MILESRDFVRRKPTKDPKILVIYCEGKKTEPKYFTFFTNISSQIRLEIVPAPHDGDNSPDGLYNKAVEDILTEEKAKYDLDETIDEVWFVIDTDTWGEKINTLRKNCSGKRNWLISQSNPCFEVWLYYHFRSEKPDFDGVEKSTSWKEFLHSIIPGGFDKRKHPVLIKEAMENSKNNYSEIKDSIPDVGSTQVHKLARSFYMLIEEKMRSI